MKKINFITIVICIFAACLTISCGKEKLKSSENCDVVKVETVIETVDLEEPSVKFLKAEEGDCAVYSKPVNGEESARFESGIEVKCLKKTTKFFDYKGKTDFWFFVENDQGLNGWIFGAFLDDYVEQEETGLDMKYLAGGWESGADVLAFSDDGRVIMASVSDIHGPVIYTYNWICTDEDGVIIVKEQGDISEEPAACQWKIYVLTPNTLRISVMRPGYGGKSEIITYSRNKSLDDKYSIVDWKILEGEWKSENCTLTFLEDGVMSRYDNGEEVTGEYFVVDGSDLIFKYRDEDEDVRLVWRIKQLTSITLILLNETQELEFTRLK